MAEELYTVGLEVKAETPEIDRFNASLRALSTTINDCTNRLQGLQGNFNNNANAVKQSAGAFSMFQNAFGPLGGQIAGMIASMTAMVSAVALMRKTWQEFTSAIRITGELKDLGETFLSLAGNTEVAQQQLIGIMRFWRTTKIFDQTDLLNAATNMQLFGIATQNIVPYLQRLATGAAAVNSTVGAMEAAMEQMIRGRLMVRTREMQIIIKQIGQDVGDQTKVIQRLMDATPSERIRMITRAVEELGTKGSASFGAIESKQAQYTGKVDALRTQWVMLKEQFASPIVDAITPIMDKMIGGMEDGSTKASQWGETVANAIGQIDKLFSSVNWGEVMDDWNKHLDKYAEGWKKGKNEIENVIDALNRVLPLMDALANYGISRFFPALGNVIGPVSSANVGAAGGIASGLSGGSGTRTAGLGRYNIPLSGGETFGERLMQAYQGSNAQETWLAPIDPNAVNQIAEGTERAKELGDATKDLGADAQALTQYWEDYTKAMRDSNDAVSREYHLMAALEKAISGLGNPMREIEKLIVGLSPDRQALARWQAWQETVNRALHETELRMKAGMAGMGETVKWSLTTMSREWGTMQEQAGKSIIAIGNSLSSNIAGGLTDILMGTKSAKEGFREMALAIIRDIERIIIQMLVQLTIQRLLGMTGAGGVPIGGGWGTNLSQGVRGYQRGGRIGYGSGGGDRVHAMLEEGEFVLNTPAASAMGYEQLEELNRKYGGGRQTRTVGGVVYAQGGYGAGPEGPWANRGMNVRSMTVGRWHGEYNRDANYHLGYHFGMYDVHSNVLPIGTQFEYGGEIYTVRGPSYEGGRRLRNTVEFMHPNASPSGNIVIHPLGNARPTRYYTRGGVPLPQRPSWNVGRPFTPAENVSWGFVNNAFVNPRATSWRQGMTVSYPSEPGFGGFPTTGGEPISFNFPQWQPTRPLDVPPMTVSSRPDLPQLVDLMYPNVNTGWSTAPSPWNAFSTTDYGGSNTDWTSGYGVLPPPEWTSGYGVIPPSGGEYPHIPYGETGVPVVPLVGGEGGYNPPLDDFGMYAEQPWADTYTLYDPSGGGGGGRGRIRPARVRSRTDEVTPTITDELLYAQRIANLFGNRPWSSFRDIGGYQWVGGSGARPTAPPQWTSPYTGGPQIGAYGVRGGGGSYFGASWNIAGSPGVLSTVGGDYVGQNPRMATDVYEHQGARVAQPGYSLQILMGGTEGNRRRALTGEYHPGQYLLEDINRIYSGAFLHYWNPSGGSRGFGGFSRVPYLQASRFAPAGTQYNEILTGRSNFYSAGNPWWTGGGQTPAGKTPTIGENLDIMASRWNRNYDTGGVADFLLEMQTGGRVKAGEHILTSGQMSNLSSAPSMNVANTQVNVNITNAGGRSSASVTSEGGGLSESDGREIARMVVALVDSRVAHQRRVGGSLYVSRAERGG